MDVYSQKKSMVLLLQGAAVGLGLSALERCIHRGLGSGSVGPSASGSLTDRAACLAGSGLHYSCPWSHEKNKYEFENTACVSKPRPSSL